VWIKVPSYDKPYTKDQLKKMRVGHIQVRQGGVKNGERWESKLSGAPWFIVYDENAFEHFKVDGKSLIKTGAYKAK
jgi:hypothetical protein